MSHVPHERHEEVPAAVQNIHEPKVPDPHSARLIDAYHTIDREIHRMETGVEPVSEDFENRKRRRRLALKNRIAVCLAS